MKLTAGVFSAALGLAFVANAAPAASPENLAPVPSASANATSISPLAAHTPAELPSLHYPYRLPKNGHSAVCEYSNHPMVDAFPAYGLMSKLGATVPDIPGTCGALWDNLRRFPSCAIIFNAWCGPHPKMDGVLIWKLSLPAYCNRGMIESAWWEATFNSFGGLNCVEVEYLEYPFR
ncbi:hypothetical protein CGRA01v4_08638 [Colletotrichum graminicola]|uniref:Uncharacterized protein n=1 Tax=Colletotrichum graminicola (strain M1.001 / M2 / FGSC 10212) TaxID=645133 RepID=E3QJA4_COLGM|nr:uncharacterized protein GLRG_06086 [Colletotrichum graminicola M1.001]EFQ30942.1 hypothetical protein GLRG_06086 [Colletotrichum graminicola M1.001]WDK17355.1 hypothetical protein CGRA01v4_08638 [Colletotrichum graminicola]